MKVYQAWTKTNNNREILTECEAENAKDFRAIIEKNDSKVTSRIRIKKSR